MHETRVLQEQFALLRMQTCAKCSKREMQRLPPCTGMSSVIRCAYSDRPPQVVLMRRGRRRRGGSDGMLMSEQRGFTSFLLQAASLNDNYSFDSLPPAPGIQDRLLSIFGVLFETDINSWCCRSLEVCHTARHKGQQRITYLRCKLTRPSSV
jgi:hypothetical protein